MYHGEATGTIARCLCWLENHCRARVELTDERELVILADREPEPGDVVVDGVLD